MDVSGLKVGQNIKIKRSDGRVHNAAVSSVDIGKKFVSVEWYEQGETKGKEIDFHSVYAMNSDLISKPPPGPGIPPSAIIALSQRPSSDRRTVASPRDKKHLRALENVTVDPVFDKQPPHKVSSIPQRLVEQAQPQRRGSNGDGSGSNGGGGGSEMREPGNGQVVKDKAGVAATAVKQSRKSNCVKEVEKLKKNRDERRAKLAEQLAQRNEEFDPGNPNWVFFQGIREFRAKTQFKPLVGDEKVVRRKITVCVRKRPLNKKEFDRKEIDVLSVVDKSAVLVHEPKTKVDLTKYLENQKFCFDYSFNEEVSNEVVYRFTAQPLVETIFEKGMATCFAYGQTGSGKTHTMGGVFIGKEQDATKGIYAMAAGDVFTMNAMPVHAEKDLEICASFFEIYIGKAYDLLDKKKRLKIMENAKQHVQVVGLREERVNNVSDVLRLIQAGNACRTSGTTSANQHSSRSHAIFQIILRKRMSRKLYGKFSLIDLAGNERGADTANSDRQTRMEGAEINRSLLALKECIRALGRKGAHLPFRGSKLTQVLKDSFVGENSRTCMIAMVSPGFNSCEHTLNTLRYADRVKELPASGRGSVDEGEVVEMALPLHRPGVGGGGGGSQDQEEPMDDDNEGGPASEMNFLQQSLKKGGGAKLDMDRSSELLNFHEAFNNLVESEEHLIEEHKAIIQADQYLLEEEKSLLAYVDDVDHDIEEYVKHMERIVSQKVERLSQFKERIQDLRSRLQEEETASKNVRHLPML